MEHDEMMFRFLEQYEAAGTDDAAGWYRESQRYARALAREHGGGAARVVGIIAALSPQVPWDRNKVMAETVMATGTTSGQTRANTWKAERIWEGERPLKVLGGPKVRAFYRAMMGDEDAAVIDTWMLRSLDWPVQGCSARQYEAVAAALRSAAGQTVLTTAQFQAVVWTSVRKGGE